jgi:hypothetical protein
MLAMLAKEGVGFGLKKERERLRWWHSAVSTGLGLGKEDTSVE